MTSGAPGMQRMSKRVAGLLLAWGLFGLVAVAPGHGTGPDKAQAADDCYTFPQTGKSVCNAFLDYWQTHGGLAQQGYPLSNAFHERSDIDGKDYIVQYFERAVFEYHPELTDPDNRDKVLLSLVGRWRAEETYPGGPPTSGTYWRQPDGTPSPSVTFPETGKTVGGPFLRYWQNNGGLAQQGFPISDLFQETSTLDGKAYYVQYFERAVFEFHPEQAAQYQVLLSQLGKFRMQEKYPAGPLDGSTNDPGAPAATPARPTPTAVPVPPTPAVPPSAGGQVPSGLYTCLAFTFSGLLPSAMPNMKVLSASSYTALGDAGSYSYQAGGAELADAAKQDDVYDSATSFLGIMRFSSGGLAGKYAYHGIKISGYDQGKHIIAFSHKARQSLDAANTWCYSR